MVGTKGQGWKWHVAMTGKHQKRKRTGEPMQLKGFLAG